MPIQTINPATGLVVRDWSDTSPEDLERILRRSHVVARAWSESSFVERASRMRDTARLLRERSDDYARIMAEEMGKPLPQGRAESEKCAWVCDYYADHAERFLEQEVAEADGGHAYVAFRPLGVVLAIMPWNFPFWQVLRFAAPAIMAGNGALLKHAPGVQGCAHAIEELLRDAGLPEGLFANLVLPESRVAGVIADPRVHAVTLTGSTRAGRAVAQSAGMALKKTVLELGGSDPYLVLADADVDAAAAACVTSRMINGGQSCIAAKRFIVEEPIRERFTNRVVELMRSKTMGDPLGGEDPDLGPMARRDLRDELHGQVERSVAAGAKLLLGGRVPERDGAWYPPTVLGDVRAGTEAFTEETFGPVASIITARDEDDAVAIANASQYGLGAAVFTADRSRGERIARDKLEAGCCFVNEFVKSDPRLPFGGIKESGYGRELSVYGIREFVNVKSVFVRE